MKRPDVSVVMSVYNDVGRLEKAVASILCQTFRDLELIAINDGSTDGSGELLDRLAAADSRMRVIHQDNSGLTRALIRGCSEAQGKFVARQDSDDWSHPLRIAEQVALIESDERIGFVSCATEYIGPGDEHLAVVRRPTDSEAATLGLLSDRQGPPAHGSVMFRKALYELVGGYRQEFYFAQDSDLWLRMAERAQIGYLQDVRYSHRKDIRSTSGAWGTVQKRFGELGHQCRQARLHAKSEQTFLDEARRLANTVVASKSLKTGIDRKAMVDAAYLLGSQLVKNGDERARGYLWQVVRSSPWRWKAWSRLAQSMLESNARQSVQTSARAEASEAVAPPNTRMSQRGPLRILTVANVRADPNSGAAGSVYYTNVALREFGHHVDEIWVGDLPIRRIAHGNLHSLIEQPRSYRKIVLERIANSAYDVIQMSQPQAYLAASALKRAGFGGLVINRSHGVELRVNEVLPRWYRRAGIPESRFPVLGGLIKFFLNRQWNGIRAYCDGIIVGCDADRRYLCERLGIKPYRIRAIPDGVAPAFLEQPRSQPTAARSQRVLHVGQFAFVKGSYLLIEIINRFLECELDATFTWVCAAAHHDLIRSSLHAPIAARVELLDWMTIDELVDVYDRHGLFVFPSIFEGFGKAPMEAMARGLCVVASDEGGMHDHIRPGENGWLCEVGNVEQFVDQLSRMFQAPADANRIAEAARTTAKELTWKKYATVAVEFYESLEPLRHEKR